MKYYFSDGAWVFIKYQRKIDYLATIFIFAAVDHVCKYKSKLLVSNKKKKYR